MWDRRAAVLEVTDGDTVLVDIDQGFGDTKEFSLRLLGVWAPEKKEPGGAETRAFIEKWVADRIGAKRWPFVITTIRVRDDSHEVRTFARYVGTLDYGNESLNVAIMAFVAANGYGGGTGSL